MPARRHWAVGLLLAGLILAGLLVLLAWQRPGVLPRAQTGPRDGFSPVELSVLRPGDFVLRRGVGLASDFIVNLLNDGTGLSHGAMVMEPDRSGQIRLVQTINGSLTGIDGVQLQSLAEFSRYNVAASLVVVRPRWSEAERQLALQAADSLLARHIPFDNSYSLADHSALYCTELLWYLLELSGWDKASRRPELVRGFLGFRPFLEPAGFRVLVSHNPAVAVTD